MKKKKQKQELKQKWYEQLIEDLKKLTFEGIVKTKHTIGKRILQDFDSNGKPKQGRSGNKRIENLSKDTGISSRDLYLNLQFVEKYPNIEMVSQSLGWRKIIESFQTHKPKPEVAPLPVGKYNIIYADPPWQYWEGGYKNQSQHYETMDLKSIKEMKVDEISGDDCILFLWATSPFLQEALDVIKAWGFKYSTVGFVWVKSKKDTTGFAFGTGNWTRANAEYLLIATKGSIPRQDASISQIIYEPKDEHSKKPAIVRDKIVQLVGDLPRIELFSRQKIEGWTMWGNEV